MKKATLFSMIITTVFYLLCGCMGYAAFGNYAPGNLLTGFGSTNRRSPCWCLSGPLPIEMHISQKKIGRCTSQWLGLQIFSMSCLVITIAAAVGSVAGIVWDL